MAQLAGQRRPCNCGVLAGAAVAFYRQSCRNALNAEDIDDTGVTAGNADGRLHCILVCSGKGAGYLAKTAAAAAPFCSGDSVRLRRSASSCFLVRDKFVRAALMGSWG